MPGSDSLRLQDPNELLRLVTDAVPVLISYVDASEHYRLTNHAYQVWHGQTAAHAVGRHLQDVVGEEAYAAIQPYVIRALNGERVTYESHVLFKTGGWRHIRATYVPDLDDQGVVRGFVALVEDVSDRAQAAERAARLQTITAALSGALDPSEVAAVVVDEIRTLLGANLGVVAAVSDDGRDFVTLRVVGYPPDYAATLATVPVDSPSMFGAVVRQREPIFTESGSERVAKYPHFGGVNVVGGNGAAASLPLIFEGRPIGAIGFGFPTDRPFSAEERDLLRTIADLCAQALERARLHAAEARARVAMEAAVRLRDEFLASASHDLKTPLTVIKGRAQLAGVQAERIGAGAGRIAGAMVTIQDAADAMSGQIDELLDVSFLRVGQQLTLDLQPVDLLNLAREEVSRWRPQAPSHTIRCESNLGRLGVVADALRLRRVLGNLLGNAVKYSPDGGEIVVSLEHETGAVGSVGSGWALIRVQDYGIGIPAADLPLVFERFHRAANAIDQARGTGLGLAGVQQVVQQHGGEVEVASVEGEGSTFTVRLPLADVPRRTGADQDVTGVPVSE